MNRDHDLTPILRGWFAADERELPESVRVAAMASIAALPQRHRRWRRSSPNLSAPARRQDAARAGLLIALLALLTAAVLLPFAGSSPSPSRIVNGWIAFSSQPHDKQAIGDDRRRGGDIYLAHDLDDLRILVDRGPGMDSNVCPVFSPDGAQLAYGERTDAGAAIVILDLAPDGMITRTSRLPLEAPISEAPCPRWSTDGTRIGSLEDGAVVVRGLDGSVLEPTDGDPTRVDWADRDDYTRPLVSPSGELSVTRHLGAIVVRPLDGSPERIIAKDSYALGGWAPDSTQVLLRDISGRAFGLLAVSVDEPHTVKVIVDAAMPVNEGERGGVWPMRRDISWQALSE